MRRGQGKLTGKESNKIAWARLLRGKAMKRGLMLTQRGWFAQLDKEKREMGNPFRVLSMRILGLLRWWGAGFGSATMVAGVVAGFGMLACDGGALAGQTAAKVAPQLVILDTDIGDDIDDAFALALVLKSPELKLLGVTTTYGDTELRARLVDRYLTALGRNDIPVITGVPTKANDVFTQAAYANHTAPVPVDFCLWRRLSVSQIPVPKREEDQYDACEKERHDATGFILRNAREYPGEITLIAIGPLNNVEAAIKRDPATFRKLKRVVMMGGSIYRGYDGRNGERRPPDAEWNISRDQEGLRALLGSGVPVFMMPLDSTQIHLEAKEREEIFAHGSPLTDQLTLLYHQWKAGTEGHPDAPTLFDPVAVTYAIRPDLCPATPLRIEVDDEGFTRPVEGAPNAQVCLKSDEKGFLELLLGRIVGDGAR
jgi:inosine-uridine nucleoside N-ribohydrolase